MKKTFFFLLFAFAFSFMGIASVVEILPFKSVELYYPEMSVQDVRISNLSKSEIEVSVIDNKSRDQVKGFGLNAMSKAVVTVEDGRSLVMKNTSSKKVRVKLTFVSRKVDTGLEEPHVTFILRNSSTSSIPIYIPSVMNPNLSPLSNSGVKLKMGQEIFFEHDGKLQLLLTVDETIKQGEKVDIARLVKEKKDELDK